MYRIFFILFLLAALTPGAVDRGVFGISEEGVETLSVFCLGGIGFLLFFLKEKAMLRHLREKLLLQREKSDITKDLSESYSYIGEANRKLELVRGFILSIPEADRLFRRGGKERIYRHFLKTVLLSCRTSSFSLRIVDVRRGIIEKEIRSGKHRAFPSFDAQRLLGLDRSVHEVDGCMIIRSPKQMGPYAAFLLFPKVMNGGEDETMLSTIATEGLILYSLERSAPTEIGSDHEL